MTAGKHKAGAGLKMLALYFRIRGILRRLLGREKTVYVWRRNDEYREMWAEAARAIGAEFRELTSDIWEVRHQEKFTRISGWLVELDNPVILRVAGNKILSYRLLAEAGLPVPPHLVFRLHQLDRMAGFMEEHKGRMFVIKPATGTSSGRGVTTHIRTYREARRAAALAAGYGGDLLIETLIPGEVCRLLYLDGELLYASRRRGLRLNGDGKSTIRELLSAENERRREDGRPGCQADLDLEATLAVQNLTLDSVPAAGESVLVKSTDTTLTDNEEIRTVYDENITPEIGDALREQGRLAARAVRSRFVGVDVITRDHRLALEEGGGIIGEVNTTPGMHHHRNLDKDGRTPSAAVRVLEYLLEHGHSIEQ